MIRRRILKRANQAEKMQTLSSWIEDMRAEQKFEVALEEAARKFNSRARYTRFFGNEAWGTLLVLLSPAFLMLNCRSVDELVAQREEVRQCLVRAMRRAKIPVNPELV